MPEISRFFGIVIYMFYDEHAPSHFHAKYAEYETVIDLENLTVLRGHLPPRVMGLVMEWTLLHQEELRANWQRALQQQSLQKIAPLV